jgi:hypothetical protein
MVGQYCSLVVSESEGLCAFSLGLFVPLWADLDIDQPCRFQFDFLGLQTAANRPPGHPACLPPLVSSFPDVDLDKLFHLIPVPPSTGDGSNSVNPLSPERRERPISTSEQCRRAAFESLGCELARRRANYINTWWFRWRREPTIDPATRHHHATSTIFLDNRQGNGDRMAPLSTGIFRPKRPFKIHHLEMPMIL